MEKKYNIIGIGVNAFNGNINLTGVSLSNSSSVFTIDRAAFYNCNKLACVNLSETTEYSIEVNVFYGCKSLNSIYLEKGVCKTGAFQKSGTILIVGAGYSVPNKSDASGVFNGLSGVLWKNASMVPDDYVVDTPMIIDLKDTENAKRLENVNIWYYSLTKSGTYVTVSSDTIGIMESFSLDVSGDEAVLLFKFVDRFSKIVPVVKFDGKELQAIDGKYTIPKGPAVSQLFIIGPPESFTADNTLVYRLNNVNMTATISNGTKATGEVWIPSKIVVDGFDYKVIGTDKASFRAAKITAIHFPETDTFEIGSSTFMSCKQLSSVDFPEKTYFKINNMAFGMCSKIDVVYLNKGEFGLSFNGVKCVLIMGKECSYNGSNINTQGIKYIIWEDASKCDKNWFSKYTINAISADDKDNADRLKEHGVALYYTTSDGRYVIVSSDSYTGMKDIKLNLEGTPSLSFEYLDYFSDSIPVVKLNNVEIKADADGKYVLDSKDLAMLVEISGAIENTYTITVENIEHAKLIFNGNFTPDKDNKINAKWGSNVAFRIIPDDGYTIDNCVISVGDVSACLYNGNNACFVIRNDATLTVSGIVLESYTVTFVGESENKTTTVTRGDTISGISGKWYEFDSNTAFDNKTKVTKDIVLFSVPASEQDLVEIDWSATRGNITVSAGIYDVSLYGKVPRGTEVSFVFEEGRIYEVIGWFVNGNKVDSSDSVLVLRADSRISVMPIIRYYQSGYQYVVDSPMPFDADDIRKVAWFGKYQDPLEGDVDDYYARMPSTPVVIGDIMYAPFGKQIWMINLNDDLSDNKKRGTYVELETAPGSLYYIDGKFITGNGYILDQNLKVICKVDSMMGLAPLTAYGGDYILDSIVEIDGIYKSVFQRIHISDDGSYNTVWSYEKKNYWGQHPQIVGDVLYFILANQSTGERGFISLNLENGEIIDKIDVSPWMQGHLYDDGWLNIQDGFLYMGSYTSGLFGDTLAGLLDTSPKFLRVAVDNGKFIEGSVEYISIKHDLQQHPSGLITFRDRGYIQSGSTLYVIDMQTYTPIYTMAVPFTHGGMILNTYYATEENGWKVYLYIVPYSGAGKMVAYEDCVGQTEGKLIDLGKLGNNQFSTRYMATSASGHMYWYNDSSVFFIYGNKTNETTFYVNGSIVSTMKLTNGSKLTLPADPVKQGYTFVGWYNYDGRLVTSDTLSDGAMRISAVWAPAFLVTIGDDIQTVKPGDKVSAPQDPTKESDDMFDYVFRYWTNNGVEFDFNSGVTSDVTLVPYFLHVAKITKDSDMNVDAKGLEEIGVNVPDDVKDKDLNISFGDNTTIVISGTDKIAGKSILTELKEIENEFDVDGTAYSLSVTADGDKYSGNMKITLPYQPVDGKVPKVYWMNGTEMVEMKVINSDDVSVTFVTDHNSVYLVSSVEDSENGLPITTIAIVAFVVIVIAAAIIVSRRYSA